MDKQDRDPEQQVWQRVRANREQGPKNDLRQLQREAMELAAVYRNLAAKLTGKQREQVRLLQAGEQANAAALAGIGKLSRLGSEQLKLWQPGKEAPEKTLERCYHRTRRCMAEYMARSAEPEFGVVFDRMAKRSAEHCALIARLLGEIP